MDSLIILAGILIPPMFSLAKRYLPVEQDYLNFLIPILASVIVGAIFTAVSGKFDIQNLATTIGSIWAISQGIFNGLKLVGATNKIENK